MRDTMENPSLPCLHKFTPRQSCLGTHINTGLELVNKWGASRSKHKASCGETPSHLYAGDMRFLRGEKNPTEDGKKNEKLQKATSYDEGHLEKAVSRIINISKSR